MPATGVDGSAHPYISGWHPDATIEVRETISLLACEVLITLQYFARWVILLQIQPLHLPLILL